MILLLDTATPECFLVLVDGEQRFISRWQADRELARGLLGFLESALASHGKQFSDITAIGAHTGPGSFTGLRIGLTVLNTLADGLSVPIVGESGEEWEQRVMERLRRGENQRSLLPYYGSEAHITSPRK